MLRQPEVRHVIISCDAHIRDCLLCPIVGRVPTHRQPGCTFTKPRFPCPLKLLLINSSTLERGLSLIPPLLQDRCSCPRTRWLALLLRGCPKHGKRPACACAGQGVLIMLTREVTCCRCACSRTTGARSAGGPWSCRRCTFCAATPSTRAAWARTSASARCARPSSAPSWRSGAPCAPELPSRCVQVFVVRPCHLVMRILYLALPGTAEQVHPELHFLPVRMRCLAVGVMYTAHAVARTNLAIDALALVDGRTCSLLAQRERCLGAMSLLRTLAVREGLGLCRQATQEFPISGEANCKCVSRHPYLASRLSSTGAN